MRSRWIVASLALFVGGCVQTESPAPAPTAPEVMIGPGSPTEHAFVPWDLTDPAEVVEAHVEAINTRSRKPYRKHLTPDFEFYPRPDEVDDFPWMTGDSWDRADELGMIRNLFAPPPPAPGTWDPVESIDASYAVVSQVDLGSGNHVWTIDFVALVLLSGGTNGFSVNTRLEILMTTDVEGIVRIREIRESIPLQPRVEDASWASVKALYR